MPCWIVSGVASSPEKPNDELAASDEEYMAALFFRPRPDAVRTACNNDQGEVRNKQARNPRDGYETLLRDKKTA